MSTIQTPPVIYGAAALVDLVRGNGWNLWHDALDIVSQFGDHWPAFVLGELPDLVPVSEEEIDDQFGNVQVQAFLSRRGLSPCLPLDVFKLAACRSFASLREEFEDWAGSIRQIVFWHEPLPNRFGVRRRLCLSAGSAGDGIFHVDAGPEMLWRYSSPSFRTSTVFLARRFSASGRPPQPEALELGVAWPPPSALAA